MRQTFTILVVIKIGLYMSLAAILMLLMELSPYNWRFWVVITAVLLIEMISNKITSNNIIESLARSFSQEMIGEFKKKTLTLDEILDKINAEGIHKLNKEEKEYLDNLRQ